MLEREGIRLQKGLKIAEDALFNLEAVLAGRGIAYVNHVTYRYRMHAQSAMHRTDGSTFDVHTPWFAAMRSMLERRGCMEAYYTAYLDTIVLRLYKDGGLPGVLRNFGAKAKPLLPDADLKTERMIAGARLLRALVGAGMYPVVYPAIWLIQVMKRKALAARCRLRRDKEMPR